MLTVMNPRSESKLKEPWYEGKAFMSAALALWAVVVIAVTCIEQPRSFTAGRWYAMTDVEGVVSYTDYPSKIACITSAALDAMACFPGQGLTMEAKAPNATR